MDINNYKLEDKLNFYQELLNQMVTKVEEAIIKSLIAFRKNDLELAKSVIKEDFIIDQLRDLIEAEAVKILIAERPYGHYIRQIIAGLKIVTNLERMGDHAAHFAKIINSNLINSEVTMDIAQEIDDMSKVALKMFRATIDALMTIDSQKAKETALIDDEIDKYRTEIKEKILKSGPTENLDERTLLYEYYYLVKEIERIGDHITTICSWIVYMDEGDKPKLN